MEFSGILIRQRDFNSQPHEEADFNRKSYWWTDQYFNSQPHEEADCEPVSSFSDATISTHSLTKRLTEAEGEGNVWFSISTHSLTKRLTSRIWYLCPSIQNFNSQPHEEADMGLEGSCWNMEYFNSQPHEEADVMQTANEYVKMAFQLTASRRGWPFRCIHGFHQIPFQLTASRRGWRVELNERNSFQGISTHSLTKRLTLILRRFFPEAVFQLTASRRGWRNFICNSFTEFVFQLTASRRGWPEHLLFQNPISHFNSQPHEEADNCFCDLIQDDISISTHSLTKRLTRYHLSLYPVGHISTHSLTKRLTCIPPHGHALISKFQLTASRRGWRKEHQYC